MKRALKIILPVLLAAALYTGYSVYKKIFTPNVLVEETSVNIPTGSGFEDVMKILSGKHILNDSASFRWVAVKMKYQKNIHPGHYVFTPGMTNKELVKLLRSGKQTPVLLVINNVRTVSELAVLVSAAIEASQESIVRLLKNENYLQQFGLNPENCLAMFIPDTYEFYWNTPANKFIERMHNEYLAFWNQFRKEKAKSIGLTKSEVSVLASIIEQETKQDVEKPIIAGVYLNRFYKGWKLEADPTLIFAIGDFSVQRVLNEYKEIDSPYNTYKYTGFPPGPICMPSIASVDAVLNFQKHDYFFFCAREDFSGYHNFARSYNEHLANARKFQRELNRRNIRS